MTDEHLFCAKSDLLNSEAVMSIAAGVERMVPALIPGLLYPHKKDNCSSFAESAWNRCGGRNPSTNAIQRTSSLPE